MSIKNSEPKSLWITWETQRRNKELALAFGCELKQFDYSNLGRIRRYLKSIVKTFGVIFANRDHKLTIFAQCPSLVLCFFLTLLKPIFRYKLIIDGHNTIFDYFVLYGPVIRFLTIYSLKRADFLIVTNQYFKESIPINPAQIMVLPDRLPEIKQSTVRPKSFSIDKPNYVFISSFSKDEPIYDFLMAAKDLTTFARFFITGRKSKADQLLLSFESSEIIFTDYLSEKNFESLISFSDMNIDLTTRSDLLVCGAYESLAVEVPCILSDTKIQRETFQKGYLYTHCDKESLKETILNSLNEKEKLKNEIIEYRTEFIQKWDMAFNKCTEQINRTRT